MKQVPCDVLRKIGTHLNYKDFFSLSSASNHCFHSLKVDLPKRLDLHIYRSDSEWKKTVEQCYQVCEKYSLNSKKNHENKQRNLRLCRNDKVHR